jgi:predicted DNA-binding transcriptional regulator AlpA
MEAKMPKQYLRKNAVAQRYGVHVRTVERMIEDKRLPRPHYNGRFPLWSEDELDASDRAFAVAAPPKRAARPKADDGGDGGSVAA